MARSIAVLALTGLLLVIQATPASATRLGRAVARRAPTVERTPKSRAGVRGPLGALARRGRALRQRVAHTKVARALTGKLPTPKSRAKAFGLGVIEGPWHTVEHLANPKALARALVTTAALGIILHLTGIPAALIATPVLVGVLAHGWWRGGREAAHAESGPERARIIGRRVAMTLEITAELAGVHALHPHGGEEEAAHAAGGAVSGLVAAGLQGILGFHELFYLKLFGKDRGAEGEGHAHSH